MAYNLFFQLIQVAIGRRDSLSRVPSAKEWCALYGLSVMQAVSGVCFCGVQRLPKEQKACLHESLRMQWLALATQIKQRNEVMNSATQKALELFRKDGFYCTVLKGARNSKALQAYGIRCFKGFRSSKSSSIGRY